jgi:hypothetical protein
MSLTNCTLTSEWDSGETIVSDAEIDLSTGEIFTKGTNIIPEGSLIVKTHRKIVVCYVTLPDGSILNVCRICHINSFYIKLFVTEQIVLLGGNE